MLFRCLNLWLYEIELDPLQNIFQRVNLVQVTGWILSGERWTSTDAFYQLKKIIREIKKEKRERERGGEGERERERERGRERRERES